MAELQPGDEAFKLCQQLFESILAPHSAAYAAGPLETGRVYYDYLVQGREVSGVRPINQQRLTEFVHLLREKLDHPVIDPGILKVPKWTAFQHGEFFLSVLREYVREIWLLDGWEYSSGATKEFLAAITLNIPCYTAGGESINLPQGIDAIRNAVKWLDVVELDGTKLKKRLREAEVLTSASL